MRPGYLHDDAGDGARRGDRRTRGKKIEAEKRCAQNIR
jgi:hypothetical protein